MKQFIAGLVALSTLAFISPQPTTLDREPWLAAAEELPPSRAASVEAPDLFDAQGQVIYVSQPPCPNGQCPLPPNRVRSVVVRRSVSQPSSSLVQLHNELHNGYPGGPDWTWTGNLEDHLRTVHGVDVSVDFASAFSSPSNAVTYTAELFPQVEPVGVPIAAVGVPTVVSYVQSGSGGVTIQRYQGRMVDGQGWYVGKGARTMIDVVTPGFGPRARARREARRGCGGVQRSRGCGG